MWYVRGLRYTKPVAGAEAQNIYQMTLMVTKDSTVKLPAGGSPAGLIYYLIKYSVSRWHRRPHYCLTLFVPSVSIAMLRIRQVRHEAVHVRAAPVEWVPVRDHFTLSIWDSKPATNWRRGLRSFCAFGYMRFSLSLRRYVLLLIDLDCSLLDDTATHQCEACH